MSRTARPDILMFLSDQHNALMSRYAGHPFVETPHLDRLVAAGTAFDAAYAACPLCVPSRLSMLSGMLPSTIPAFDNDPCLGDQATFLHALGAAGYETVLCGRMHLIGPDQRRGFTRRIMGEYAPDYTGRYGPWFEARPHHAPSHGGPASLNIIGGGDSPVLAYDRDVVEAALDYLAEDHDKPQCIVIGTYGPHFPYVAPRDRYEHYLGRATLPVDWRGDDVAGHPILASRVQRERTPVATKVPEPVDVAAVTAAVAAYSGMISTIDEQVGAVYEAWNAWRERSGRPGVFMYASDHGDMNGRSGMYGKMTFYESAVRVPLIVVGDGVVAGRRVDAPVSLLDIAPTLCALADATGPPMSQQAGVDLSPVLSGAAPPEHRAVVSELVVRDRNGSEHVPARMIRRDRWKLIRYAGHEENDQLFDLESDPDERTNRVADSPDPAESLRQVLLDGWDPVRIATEFDARIAHHAVIDAWARTVAPEFPDLWTVPESAKAMPEVGV